MASLWRGVHGTLHVYCGHAALSIWANKHADSDAKHTANWLISCSLVSLCVIMREPVESMERNVAAVQGQKWLIQPGYLSALKDLSPLGLCQLQKIDFIL